MVLVPGELVKKLVDRYSLNMNVIPLSILKRAVQIEFEHKDIIGHDIDKAFHIVMAHLREFPDYYQRLIKMEADASRFWSGKVKPNIYNHNAGPRSTQIRSSRTQTSSIKQERKPRDLYGIRKGSRKRRTAHFYPDYIPKQSNQKREYSVSKSAAERHVSWAAPTDRSIQTESIGPENDS